MFVAALGTFAVVAPLMRLAGQPDGLNVLAVVVAVTASRRARHGAVLDTAVGLPVVAALTSMLAWLLVHERYAAEALIVVAMYVSIANRTAPPHLARAARLLTLPMLVLFVAPAPVHRGFWIDLPWYVLVSAIAGAWVLLADRIVGGASEPPPPLPPSRSARRPSAITRVAMQASSGLALAFATSQWLFPHRWSWAIVSAFAVSGGARSRGHVLLRSGERLLGALTGTVLATLLAAALASHTVASVTAIFALLACGAVLGEVRYVFWAFCVTSMLALLYGLYGQSGAHLLHERLEENVLGAACIIAPAFLLLPVRTSDLIRRYAALSLATVDELLVLLAAPERDEDAIRTALGELDRRVALLGDAAAPALVGRRIVRSAHRASAARVTGVRAAAAEARALAGDPGGRAIAALRREVRDMRRALVAA
jgi:fusaric acid resistance family protein